MEFWIIAVPSCLAFFAYLGWARDKRWARVTTIIIGVFIIGLIALVGFFVSTLGQTNRSL